MAFTSRSQVLQAKRFSVQYMQATNQNLSGANNWPWFSNLGRLATAIPGTTLPATFGTAPGGTTYDRTTSGALVTPNASAGHQIRIVNARARSDMDMSLTLVEAYVSVADRLLDVVVDQSITTLQTLNTGVLPSRCTNGWGIMALEANASLVGATAVTCTVSYTNQDGVSGRTSTLNTGTSTWAIFKLGTMLYMPLQAGDYGVQSIQSFQITGTASSSVGNKLGLAIFDHIGPQFDLAQHIDSSRLFGHVGEKKDFLSTGLASFDPSACLELHYYCGFGNGNTGPTPILIDMDMVID